MYVCMHACMYVQIYIHVNVCVYSVYLSIYIYIQEVDTQHMYILPQVARRYFDGVCVLRRSFKSSMYLVNARLVVRNAAKTQQIRGWTSDMLPIAFKQKGKGCYLGTHTIGWGGRNTEHETIYPIIYPSLSIAFSMSVSSQGYQQAASFLPPMCPAGGTSQ